MDLESIAEELYAGSPDDFVERRTRWVAEARAARERPLAKSISQLRRPSRSAWMVNLLSRQASEDVRALLDLGTALGEAQQRAAGDDLRRLSSQRQAALAALTRRAGELAAVAGHAATETTRQEVSSTLQAALADAAVADLVRAGRVTSPATYGGFGPLDLFAGAASPPPSAMQAAAMAKEPGSGSEPPEQPPESDQARREADEAVGRASEVLEAAEHEAAQAALDAEDATRRADELAEAVEALRERLQRAEDEERQAGELARAARRRASQQQRAVADASRALAETQGALGPSAAQRGDRQSAT